MVITTARVAGEFAEAAEAAKTGGTIGAAGVVASAQSPIDKTSTITGRYYHFKHVCITLLVVTRDLTTFV